MIDRDHQRGGPRHGRARQVHQSAAAGRDRSRRRQHAAARAGEAAADPAGGSLVECIRFESTRLPGLPELLRRIPTDARAAVFRFYGDIIHISATAVEDAPDGAEERVEAVQGCGAAAAQGRQAAAAARLRRVWGLKLKQAGHRRPQGQPSGHWHRDGSRALQAVPRHMHARVHDVPDLPRLLVPVRSVRLDRVHSPTHRVGVGAG
eukprot:scaffold4780_cov120-Isochrysis_galbana.AAC.5